MIADDKVDMILADETEDTFDNLLNDQVLQKHGVDSKAIDERVQSTLISAGVEVRVAQALAQGGLKII
jgi:hypothetical protein